MTAVAVALVAEPVVVAALPADASADAGRLRVWHAAPDRYRIAQLSTSGEQDLTRTPGGEFSWDHGASTLPQIPTPWTTAPA